MGGTDLVFSLVDAFEIEISDKELIAISLSSKYRCKGLRNNTRPGGDLSGKTFKNAIPGTI